MASELLYQRRLIVEVRKVGGFGVKLSNQFRSGVPDVLLSLPDAGPWLVEMKVCDRSHQEANVSPIQHATMTDMARTGIDVAVVVCYTAVVPIWLHKLVVRADMEIDEMREGWTGWPSFRPGGAQWPVHEMFRKGKL